MLAFVVNPKKSQVKKFSIILLRETPKETIQSPVFLPSNKIKQRWVIKTDGFVHTKLAFLSNYSIWIFIVGETLCIILRYNLDQYTIWFWRVPCLLTFWKKHVLFRNLQNKLIKIQYKANLCYWYNSKTKILVLICLCPLFVLA